MADTNNRGCLSNLLWAIPFALLAGLISKGIKNLNMIHPAASTSSYYGSSVVDGTTASKTEQYSSSVPVGKKMTFTKLLERSPRPTQAELIRTLEAGADPNEHILFPPAQFEKMKQMMTMIATSVGRSSNEPITRENFFNTPLTLAASMEGMTFFNELMKRGADPNIKLHPLGTPPLQIAISGQKLEMVKALLDHGADPEQLSYMGNAVSAAVASWKSKDESIMTAMSEHLKGSGEKHLIYTFEKIANKSFADRPNTVDARSFKILKMLLDKNARVDVKNQNGLDPIVSALIARNYTAFIMLLPHYQDLDAMNYELDGMKIPLAFVVAKSGKVELMRLVLERGVDTNARLSNGDTLVDWAETPEIKKLIEDYKADHPNVMSPASVVRRVYQESKLEGWTKVVSEGNIEFRIPPTMEVQGGAYRKVADKMKETILKVRPDAKEIVIQQAGLNTNAAPAKARYVRIMYKCEKSKPGENWKIDEKLVLSEDEVKELDDTFRESVDRGMIIAQRRTSVRHSLIRWDPTEVVPFGNGTAIKMSYCRQLSSNPPVELRQYQIGDDDRMHYITFSYRQSEKDLWLPDWETIKKTIKFIR